MSGEHTVRLAGRLRIRDNHGAGKIRKRNGAKIFIRLFPIISTILPLTLAHASGGGAEEGSGWVGFSWKLLNFLVLAGIIYWLAAKKANEFFSGRQQRIKTSLAGAVTAREDAARKSREYEAKLDHATGEIDELVRIIEGQGLAEKGRIIEEARKAAEKMKEETRTRMEQEYSNASRQLTIEVVRLSAQLAEGLLQKNIRAEDHDVMVRDYIEKVVRKNGSATLPTL